jgi:hypothetical protein
LVQKPDEGFFGDAFRKLGPAVFFAAVALRAFFGLFDIMKFTG